MNKFNVGDKVIFQDELTLGLGIIILTEDGTDFYEDSVGNLYEIVRIDNGDERYFYRNKVGVLTRVFYEKFLELA